MGITGIDQWVIVVADVPRTLACYERLGLPIAWEKRPGRPDMPTIRIGENQKLNVHARDWPDAAGYLGARRPSIGGADFCLEWAGTVQDVVDHLKRAGVTPEAGPFTRMCARGPSTSVYFRDPDDNLVELTVYPSA